MADYQQPLQVLDFPRASMYTLAPGSDRERASLVWSVLNGNPRLTCWTRVPDDKDKGRIQAGIGITAMLAMLSRMEEIYKGAPDDRNAMDVLGANKDASGNLIDRTRVMTSRVLFGKNADGICWISLVSADESRPRIVFNFGAFEWHPLRKRNGEEFTASEISQVHALSVVEYLRNSFLKLDKGVTPEEKKAMSESRQKGNTNSQNRTSSYSQQSSSPKIMNEFNENDFNL